MSQITMKFKSDTVKKIVAVIVSAAIIAAAFFAGYYTHKLTRPSYAATYEWAVKTIKKNYFYDFDLEQCEGLSLKDIGAKLDRYSEFYTAEEYKEILSENGGEKSGVGISYNFIDGVGARIISVLGNSPAYMGGIRAGDTVIGGIFTDGGGEQRRVDFTTAQTFADFIDGRETGEKFSLISKADGGKEGENGTISEVSKEIYTASYAFYATKNTAWEVRYAQNSKQPSLIEAPKDKIAFLPENTAYIRLNQFYGNAGDEFGKLVEKFNAEGCNSLILDLRNNGGGYVSVMQDIAGYFTSAVTDKTFTAMTARYKNGKKETYACIKHSGAGLVPQNTQIYVLANSGTASASEALIGVLVGCGVLKYENIFLSDFSQEYLDFAGEGVKTAQSYGKGIMQTTFVKPVTGEALKLTTAQIYWPDGKCIHDVGLTAADGCRTVKADWTATQGDTELAKICEEYIG